MAEIVDNNGQMHDVPSQGKANAALTLGIIGSAISVLGLGGMAGLSNGIFGGKKNDACITNEELYLERQNAADKLSNQRELTNAFFDAYKRDIDNSFNLYKNQRDGFDVLNQKIIDSSFNLYKNHRDEKDELSNEIAELRSKIDVMAAIRPYQDALINCKIDNNALMSDYKLYKRTCRMIEGQLVLPTTPVVTGYTSYDGNND